MSVTDKGLTIKERIAGAILVLRGQRVILDVNLAELYGVETRALIQAVKRSADRFPPDFMFPLNKQEVALLRSQIVISSGHGGLSPACQTR